MTRTLSCSLICKIFTRPLSIGSNSVKKFHEIPGPKPLPLIGNIWRYLPLIGDYKINQLYQNARYNRSRYGPIVREQITSNHTILHLFDPDDIETFFRLDGNEPYRRSHRALLKYRRDLPELYNDGGLFPENGPAWSRQHETTLNCLVELVDNHENRVVFVENFEKFLYIWSLKCSLAVFLDYRRDDMPSEQILIELIDNLHNTLDAIDGTEIKSERWLKQPNKCPFFKQLSKAEGAMHTFVTRRIDNLADNVGHEGYKGASYVRDWLKGDKFDRKDVITFILDCILASLHTTAYTTAFLLKHISSSTGRQDELGREISQCLPTIDKTLQTDPSDSMPLLKDCLKETLRLRPVSIGTGRLTQDEMVIRDYQIPSGVMVIAHNQTICMDASIYEQPESYWPERWAKYRKLSRDQRPSAFAWLPFGFGPRACIGQRLVTLQIQILAARLMQQFKFEFLNNDEIKTKSMLVHTLNDNIRMKLTRLTSSDSTN